MLYQKRTINCKGKLVSLEKPVVMGILNLTPDSFFDGGKFQAADKALAQTEKMLLEGATFIDVGGMSSRPGSLQVDTETELKRIIPTILSLAEKFPEALLSVDTYRAKVATEAIHAGAHIINDISAGEMDEAMPQTVADLDVPYIIMHMQGTPETMQENPHYEDPTRELLDFFIRKIGKLRGLGIKDIIIDPGFGFGKTLSHNYQILKQLHVFQILEQPILVGISRKSLICKVLKVKPENALNGTTALHMVALQQGASILRVHDVKPAIEAIQLWEQLEFGG